MKNALCFPIATIGCTLSLAALSLAFSAPAEAIIVNVSGTNYKVTTFFGNYTNNVNRFSSTEMPWFGNQLLAQTFASTLFPITPTPNGGLPGNVGGNSPFFAWNVTNPTSGAVQYVYTNFSGVLQGAFPSSTGTSIGNIRNYAVAQAVVAVPIENDALPVVGSALFMAGGMWWKRKRAQAKANDFIAPK